MMQISYVVEALLITILAALCFFETVSDLKTGTIRNKSLLIAAIAGGILDIIYYGFFERVYLTAFLMNTVTIIVVAILFYSLRIWAAGDSKLLMITVILIPARFYYAGDNIMAVAGVMIIIFSIAFIYLIVESLYLGIKHRNFFDIHKIQLDIRKMLFQYIRCICLVTLFSMIASKVFPVFYNQNPILMMIIDMVIILGGYRLVVFERLPLFALLIAATVGAVIVLHGDSVAIDGKIYLIVIIVFMLRLFMEKYNYDEIAAADVEPGMVMSYAAIADFMPSRIKNLPTSTTEDIRSKISSVEAESIKRWEKSSKGKRTIIIVRKIPFAVFISIGVLTYVGICIVML